MTRCKGKTCGFSLIEILLVLALLGLVSSVCVLHFDAIQGGFFGENRDPVSVLERAIQTGRLLANKNHCKVALVFEPNEIVLKDFSSKVLERFSLGDKTNDIRTKLLAGKLSVDGLFEPSMDQVSSIEFNEEGFIKSTFVEINIENGDAKFEVDVLTGALKPKQW